MRAGQRAGDRRIAQARRQHHHRQREPRRVAAGLPAQPRQCDQPGPGEAGMQRRERRRVAHQRAAGLQRGLVGAQLVREVGGDQRLGARFAAPGLQPVAGVEQAELPQRVDGRVARDRTGFAPQRGADDRRGFRGPGLAAAEIGAQRAVRPPEEVVGGHRQPLTDRAGRPALGRAAVVERAQRRPVLEQARRQEYAAEGRDRQPPVPQQVGAHQRDQRQGRRRGHARPGRQRRLPPARRRDHHRAERREPERERQVRKVHRHRAGCEQRQVNPLHPAEPVHPEAEQPEAEHHHPREDVRHHLRREPWQAGRDGQRRAGPEQHAGPRPAEHAQHDREQVRGEQPLDHRIGQRLTCQCSVCRNRL
jgi:hypothetical protein